MAAADTIAGPLMRVIKVLLMIGVLIVLMFTIGFFVLVGVGIWLVLRLLAALRGPSARAAPAASTFQFESQGFARDEYESTPPHRNARSAEVIDAEYVIVDSKQAGH